MTARKAITLGLIAFTLALVLVLPSSWVSGALPPGVQCGGWAGSVWRGQCSDLTVSDGGTGVMRVASVRWKLRPAALLRLALSAEVEARWDKGEARGEIAVGRGGVIRVRAMNGTAVFDRQLIRTLPDGWHGRAEIRDLEADWNAGTIGRMGGELLVSELADGRGNALGSYRLQIPAADTPPFAGRLNDTGGPVEVEAELRLEANRSWSLAGRMRARDASDLSLSRKLDVLGFADATGWRMLSAAGDFS